MVLERKIAKKGIVLSELILIATPSTFTLKNIF